MSSQAIELIGEWDGGTLAHDLHYQEPRPRFQAEVLGATEQPSWLAGFAAMLPTGKSTMNTRKEFQVTLSDELLMHLRKESKSLQVPLRWLVAGLISDTVENIERSSVDHAAPFARG